MTPRSELFEFKATALADDDAWHEDDTDFTTFDGDQLEREERAALRRVAGLSTELEDVTEVEYRQLRLERVVLAGVWTEGTVEDAENSMRELAALAETAGSTVLAGVIQRRPKPDAATFLGSGKAQELRDIVIAEGADTVICDGELSPGQRRALEDVVKVKVIDRTALILDIFAQHAKSREGKAQVELAQLQYLLPRLRGWGESMSRQAGGQAAGGQGMGSRGPGETKIELDRRRINTRDGQAQARDQGHEDRPRHQAVAAARRTACPAWRSPATPTPASPRCSTGSPAPASWSRTSCSPPSTRPCAGPRPPTAGSTRSPTPSASCATCRTQLVEAFRSTLEEVGDSDLLLHVVDGSHPDPEGQISAVRGVLAEVGGDQLKEIIVVNKADAADPEVLDRLGAQREALRRRVGPHRRRAWPSCRRSSPRSCRARTSR